MIGASKISIWTFGLVHALILRLQGGGLPFKVPYFHTRQLRTVSRLTSFISELSRGWLEQTFDADQLIHNTTASVKTLPRVAAEMALHVLAYKLTRVMNIIGVQPLMTAMRA